MVKPLGTPRKWNTRRPSISSGAKLKFSAKPRSWSLASSSSTSPTKLNWIDFSEIYLKALSANSRARWVCLPASQTRSAEFLKGAAKAVAPLAGQAVGAFFGGPLGAQVGRGAATVASNILGLEAELNAEDYEFEGAKTFVRMAADAVKTAATAPPDIDPSVIAGTAVTAAAEKHTPGLLESAQKSGRHDKHAGRWVRRGRNVIILNCA